MKKYTNAIQLRGVSKRFGQKTVLHDVSLTVPRGQVFGYLGPNGAGKSTTIHTVMGFIRPNEGSISLLGGDSQKDSTELKRHIGYVAGDFAMYGHMTGRELLHYLQSLRGSAVKQAVLDGLIERLGCQLDTPIRHLSRGNKQKIALAQALMHEPELLILDEATSGLDPLSQEVFYDLLADAKARGTTVFFSSHNIAEVERISDRVGIIREGVLVADTSMDELRHSAPHPFKVRFAKRLAHVHQQSFADVGAKNVAVDTTGQMLTCQIVGPVDAFIKLLSQFEVESLVSGDVDLEEFFLKQYEEIA
jgi:ABC-2 type transport system ATP-binding protein